MRLPVIRGFESFNAHSAIFPFRPYTKAGHDSKLSVITNFPTQIVRHELAVFQMLAYPL